MMTNYFASFDPTSETVTGWYDNSTSRYNFLPPSASALPVGYVAVDAEAWAQHLTDLSLSTWKVVDGVATYTAPVTPAPTAVQVAAAAYGAFIADGLSVTSTATPALNGTYGIGPSDTADISAEAQFISAFSEFTSGNSTAMPWQQVDGTVVTFISTSDFLNFAKIAAQTVTAAKLAAISGAAMPSRDVVIP